MRGNASPIRRDIPVGQQTFSSSFALEGETLIPYSKSGFMNVVIDDENLKSDHQMTVIEAEKRYICQMKQV
jgi:hypothetical protein